MKDAADFETLPNRAKDKFRQELTNKINNLNYPVTYVIEVQDTTVFFTIAIKGAKFNPLVLSNYTDHKSADQGYGLKMLRELIHMNVMDCISYEYKEGVNRITVILSNSTGPVKVSKVYDTNTTYTFIIPYNTDHFSMFSSLCVLEGIPDKLQLIESTYEYLDFKLFFGETILNYIMYSGPKRRKNV